MASGLEAKRPSILMHEQVLSVIRLLEDLETSLIRSRAQNKAPLINIQFARISIEIEQFQYEFPWLASIDPLRLLNILHRIHDEKITPLCVMYSLPNVIINNYISMYNESKLDNGSLTLSWPCHKDIPSPSDQELFSSFDVTISVVNNHIMREETDFMPVGKPDEA